MPGGGMSTGPGAYTLQAMPAGTVTLQHDGQGNLTAHVTAFGLTPGSSHDVLIEGDRSGPEVRFSTLTADATGQVNATLTATSGGGSRLRHDSRLVILLGTGGGSATGGGSMAGGGSAADGGSLAGEPIAQTRTLNHDRDFGPLTLQAVTASADGSAAARPSGRTTISYDAAAQTLIVTVTAFGLTPGAHAAHIHLGSCMSQGAVKYMLADFMADGDGNIINETRTVTGVTSVPGPGNWYLNLHQGDMNQILANGMPTLLFRPMLCTGITSFAMTGGMTSGSPSPSGSPSMDPSMSASPTQMPMPSPSGTPSPMPSGSATTSPNPTAQPTHF